MKFILFVVFLLSKISLVFGEDLSTCAMKKTPDEQNYCKASFAGSGTFCDMIKNGEKKGNAIFWLSKFKEIMRTKLKNTSLLNLRKNELIIH